MGITENIDRIEQGKTSIISSIKSKGVNVPNDVLINEIAPYINEIKGGGDVPYTPKTELEQKYEGATVIRVDIPTDNYEFAINLCNDATKATYDADWGDGSTESGLTTDEQHHTYAKAGVYDINIYNLSNNITLGGGISKITVNGNSFYVSYLSNNTNNDYWSFRYVNIRDLIISSILIGDKITSIGEQAFQSCSSLTSIDIPNSVTSIGEDAFQYCSSLTSIDIPNSVTSIGNYTFRGCSSLTSITIPNSVTTIGEDAFYGCSSLTSIDIPNSVTTIGEDAFYGCSSLTSIDIPNSVTSIGNYTFQSCSSLTSIYSLNPTAPTIQSSSFPTSSFKYTKRYLYVPKGATGYDTDNWKTYLIDKGWELRYIEERIKTPTTMKLKTVNNFLHKWDYIGQAKLVDYELVDNEYIYHFDDKIEELIQNTFYKDVLKEIELPEGVEVLVKDLFYQALSLTTLNIPSTVRTIGERCFNRVPIQEIIIPEGVEKLPKSMCESCNLKNIVISSTVTTIDSRCFMYNSYLSTITSLNPIAPTIQSDSFSEVGTKVPFGTPKILRVPKGATGYDTGNWKTYLIDKGYTLEYIEPTEPSEPKENEDILIIENVDTVEGTVKMNNPNNIAIQYSTNGSEFNEYTTASEIPIGVGEKVYFKWGDVISNESNSTALVSSSVKYKVYGELKQGNESYAYYNMFIHESNLIDASKLKLPETALAEWCYSSMFSGCTSLTTAPELPATYLASSCYYNMFRDCTSLTTTPELPATTLSNGCYDSMFRNCTSLTTAPSVLPATTLKDRCYLHMFSGCTSLTTAPILKAKTLASYCYQYMFYNCSSLNYVKTYIEDWRVDYTVEWLSGVASEGTVETNCSNITLNNNAGVPSGWTVIPIQ